MLELYAQTCSGGVFGGDKGGNEFHRTHQLVGVRVDLDDVISSRMVNWP